MPLPDLTPDQIEVFRTRAYTLMNAGTFYLRGLIDTYEQDTEDGAAFRNTLAQEETHAA